MLNLKQKQIKVGFDYTESSEDAMDTALKSITNYCKQRVCVGGWVGACVRACVRACV